MRIDQLSDRSFVLGILVGALAFCHFSIFMDFLMKERKETSTLQTMTRSSGGRRITKNEEDSDGEGSNDEDGDGDCLCSKH